MLSVSFFMVMPGDTILAIAIGILLLVPSKIQLKMRIVFYYLKGFSECYAIVSTSRIYVNIDYSCVSINDFNLILYQKIKN